MTRAKAASSATPAQQLTRFIAKFDPAIGKLARAVRTALRKRFPTANELVYDNYNALAIGYSATDRASDSVVSLAVVPKGVALSFYYGAALPDPENKLQGSGNQNRYVRLERVADLTDPAVEALLRKAIERAKTPLPSTGRGSLIIKSVSVNQRPRRTAS